MIVTYTGKGKAVGRSTTVRLAGEACGGKALVEFRRRDGDVRLTAVDPRNLHPGADLFDDDSGPAKRRLKEIAR